METARTPISRVVIAAALLVFLASILGSWHVTQTASDTLTRALIDEEPTTVSMLLELAPDAEPNAHVLLNRTLDAEIQLRAAKNRQALNIIAISAAFTFIHSFTL